MAITTGDFILSLRRKLRDEREEKWSDDGLKDDLNTALAKLSRDLLLYRQSAEYTAAEGQTLFPLPQNKVHTIAVYIDDEPVEYKSFDWIDANKKALSGAKVYAYETQDGLFFDKKRKAGEKIRVSYHFATRVDNMDELLPVPSYAVESLMLYCLYLANESEPSEAAIKKAGNYLALYEAESMRLKASINKNNFSRNITTDYQVV